MARGAHTGAGARSSALSLKARALALLAQRDHSVVELRRKLLAHVRTQRARDADPAMAEDPAAEDAARVDEALDWLRAQGHLSEARFVESRVHARAGRYGNLRIRQELAQHGVALPPQTAQALQDSEVARAAEVWRRKFGVAPADAAARARQSRFLAQRGFSADAIAHVMRQAGAGGDTASFDDI